MSKITKLEGHIVKAIAAAINAAVEDVNRLYGVKIRVGGGNYGDARANLKCQIDILDASGASNAAKAQFDAWAGLLGLSLSDFGRRFMFRGVEYEINGVNPNAPKFAVSAMRVYDKKQFKFPVAAVRSYAPPVSARRSA